MAWLEKHRDETERYAIDFVRRLDVGEDLTGEPTIKVLLKSGSGYEDKSADFIGTVEPALNGSRVEFELVAAAAGEQTQPYYIIEAFVLTTTGRAPVATVVLRMGLESATA